MSALKPAAKRPRTTPLDVQPEEDIVEVSDPLTSSAPITREDASVDLTKAVVKVTEKRRPPHPKGHKVKSLKEVWDTIDSGTFLPVTDTFSSWDVYFQPIEVKPSNGKYATVRFLEIVNAPKIKAREGQHDMALDDLLRTLYLMDAMVKRCQGVELNYNDWLRVVNSAYCKARDVEKQQINQADLCDFIIRTYREFTLYPFKSKMGMFFRKICYHSYQAPGQTKFPSLSMQKCIGGRGKFEYMMEVRMIPIPTEWWDVFDFAEKKIETSEKPKKKKKVVTIAVDEDDDDVPDTQPMDM